MRISDWSSDVCSSDLFLVAEIFSDGEARQSHASARARRFVHLAIDQRHLGTFADRIAVCILGDNARIEKFVIKVVALTSTLTNTRAHGGAAMALRDVVDAFLTAPCLAHPSTTAQTDLADLFTTAQNAHNLVSVHHNPQYVDPVT